MQSASSRIWTRVTVSISYDVNHYTMGTSFFKFAYLYVWILKIGQKVLTDDKIF